MAPCNPIVLSEAEQAIVNSERESHPNALVRRKMLVLWLSHCGVSREQSATVAELGRATVQRYLAAYREGGLEGLRHCGNTGPVSDLAPFADIVKNELTASPPKPATTLKSSRASVTA